MGVDLVIARSRCWLSAIGYWLSSLVEGSRFPAR